MKLLQQFKQRIRNWTHKLSLKKRISLLLAILLFLTPTTIAILYVYSVDLANHTKNYLSLTLYDENDESIVSEEGYADDASLKSLLGIFFAISQSKKTLSALPFEREGAPFVRAELMLNGSPSEWLCYFSLSESEGYCIDESGSAYAIRDSVNQGFLSTPYAESFYPSAIPPTLLTIDNDTVIPEQVEWHYRNCKKETILAKNPISSTQTVLYEMSGELDLSFSSEPDTCHILVKQDDKTLFDGSYEDFPAVTAELGTVLRVWVNAQWHASPRSEAFGTLQYQFSVQIRNHALFSVHTPTATCGDVLLISCANISNPAKIKLIDTNNVGLLTPKFYTDGNFVRALLAIPRELPTNQLTFEISYGATSKSFLIPVSPREESQPYNLIADESILSLAKNASVLSSKLLKELPTSNSPRPYFRGNFLNPIDQGLTVSYRHGNRLTINANQEDVIRSVGTEFRTGKIGGVGVQALQNGVVLFIGQSDLLGNYVVLDHGCGLYTWYAHLSSIRVKVGDVLKIGDLVGNTGTGGIFSGEGVLILASTAKAFINPSCLFGQELPLTQFDEVSQDIPTS